MIAARNATLAALLTLIMLYTLDAFTRPQFHALYWLLHSLPLLLFLPAVWQGHPRSLIWLCFVTLIFFTEAVVWIFQAPSLFSAALVTATVVLFMSAMIAARQAARARNQQQ